MKRYAAKLLFQFRVVINGDSAKRRTCEERIVLFEARTAKQALAAARRRGKSCELEYMNSKGHPVYFEFIGVMDLLELGLEAQADEVWYDIVRRQQPSERRDKLIPPDSELNAIKLEALRK